jgi:hypothetical protein
MTRSDEPELTGPRWSAAVNCPRQCVYGATGAPATPFDEKTEKILKRGKAWEKIIIDEIADSLRAQNIGLTRQAPVKWPADDPIGTGHADAIILDGVQRVVEVVSTAGGALPERKALQVAGYALNSELAKDAVVISVDTHTGDDTVYPIDLEGLEPRIREIEFAVTSALSEEVLPERVCQTPLSGPARMCPYREHCFEGWEWPPLDDLLDDSEVAVMLADNVDDIAMIKEELNGYTGKRDELRDELRPLFPAGEWVQSKGIEIRRTEFRRRSFSLGDYESTGHALPADATEFIKESAQERWTVRRQPDA